MKSVFQKTAAFVLIFSSVAIAAGLITKDEVNKKVAAIAAPYNNETTSINVEFTDLNVDTVRALDFGLAAFVSKKGTANELILKLSNAAYHYGDGANPTVTGDLSLQLDMVKAFGQKTLNDAAVDFEEVLKNMAAEYTQKYGAAVTVDAKVEELIKDANGDVESAKIRLGASIDFAKLPASLTAADVEFKSFQAQLGIGRTGATGSLNVVMNPENKAFAADQPGLKEIIEKLLNDDQKAFDDINQMIQFLDGFADSIVNQEPPAPQPQP
jgi:hypothetical protein